MSSKTKIVVIQLKELIYTTLFVVLGILLVLLLIFMFLPGNKKAEKKSASVTYVPGVYTASILLNENAIDVEVAVDANHINSIRLVHLDNAVTAMYPLIEPTLEHITKQIYENQSCENINYSADSKYTSIVLLDAIKNALSKATPKP